MNDYISIINIKRLKVVNMIYYGNHQCEEFKPLNGIKDPLFLEWLDRIKEIDFMGYELWIYGGILEGWETYDIDGTILGRRHESKINNLLDHIVRISFELGVFPDIKWSEDPLYDPNKDIVRCCNYAYYRGEMMRHGEFVKWTEFEDGLYERGKCWPMKKRREDHVYKSPIRLI